MIVSGAQADEKMSAGVPVESIDAGLASFPYLQLTDEDFEKLAYALFKKSAPDGWTRDWDDAAVMVRGADAGRDLLLTSGGKAAGFVQCKRLESGLALPAVFREISKLILFAHVNGDVTFDRYYTYILALARDPAATVVDFFARRAEREKACQDQIRDAARAVRDEYKTFSAITPSDAEALVIDALRHLTIKLIRPAELNQWIGREPSVSQSFFKQRLVIDAKDANEHYKRMEAMIAAMSAKVEGLPTLTDVDMKLILERIEKTPETHRLHFGLAALFGYPADMFAETKGLEARLGRISKAIAEIDADYIDWIFKKSRDYANEVLDDGMLLYTVHPFARQVPAAFLGEIAKQCSDLAMGSSVMGEFIRKQTGEPYLRDDDGRLDHIRGILLDSGYRYLDDDFSALAGDEELVRIKKGIIAQFMHGITSRADLEAKLDAGIATLKPSLFAKADKLRTLCGQRTSIVLTHSGLLESNEAIKRMTETLIKLESLKKPEAPES